MMRIWSGRSGDSNDTSALIWEGREQSTPQIIFEASVTIATLLLFKLEEEEQNQ